jgi:alpha-1,6-mannosyltransferase
VTKIALVVVSSLYDYKRIELAIDAVAELRRRGRPATLEIVGRPIEPEYAAMLRRRVHDLNLDDIVRFVGEATPEQVREAYRSATVAVVTSATESFCHPILEAFSAGVPVVVPTDLSVAREIAEDAAAYAMPTGTAIADEVDELFRQPDRYDTLVVAGTRRLERFSWDRAAAATAELLLSCAQ